MLFLVALVPHEAIQVLDRQEDQAPVEDLQELVHEAGAAEDDFVHGIPSFTLLFSLYPSYFTRKMHICKRLRSPVPAGF